MARVGRLLAVALLVGASVGIALPVTPAHSEIVKTQISLADFKAAMGLSSVRTLLNRPGGGGLDFWMVKRDKNGDKIDWSDPGRAAVDESKSFIVFKIDTTKISPEFAELFQVKAIKKGSSSPTTLDLEIKGDHDGGVSVVSGEGAVVSPS